MTTPPPNHGDERLVLLDRYLDDLLSSAEQAAFEARLAAERDLADAVACQRRVDESLERYARPPDAAAVLQAAMLAAAAQAQAGTDSPGRAIRPPVGVPGWRRLAIAAVLVLGLIGSWQIYRLNWGGPQGRYDVGPHRTMAQAYRHTIEEGFTAKWVCRDDREFALVFLDQFGDMLSMNFPLPAGVEALGLKYFDVISPRTISMLARVEGVPVMVFVDRLERDHDTVREVPPGLSLHRRQLGSLVLYEITPRDEPALIFHLQRPETLPECDTSEPPGQ